MAEKAIKLDPDLADAHLSLGLALQPVFDWQGAQREIKRALELNPNLAFAHDQYGGILCDLGQFEEGFKEIRAAVELDPLSLENNGDYALYLGMARRYDAAIAQARATLDLDPNYVVAYHWLVKSLLGKRDAKGAIREAQKGKKLNPQPFLDADIGYAYGILGDRTRAENVLRSLDDQAKHRFVSPFQHSIVYLGLGEKDKALDWLDRCYTQQDADCQWFHDPIFDSVRQEPRYQALLKKVGLNN